MSIWVQKRSRRDFIHKTARGAAGLLLFSSIPKATSRPTAKSTVVLVHDEKAVNGTVMDMNAVQAMMDSGITRLTGMNDIGEAWKNLFPGISQTSVIGIKVNCINHQLSSHPQVAFSIANGLKKMQIGGTAFPENNIIIWDRTSSELKGAGYTINKTSIGIRCFGTNEAGVGNTGLYAVDAGGNQQLSKILVNQIHYLINLCVLKNHGDGGVTLSMKNHYGSCGNPGGLEHGNGCARSIPSLNSLSPIRQKQVVVICDALFGIISGGPGGAPQVAPKSMIFSRDPVALDFTGAKMLADNGCRTASIASNAKHIPAAAQPPYSLGTCDPANIDTIRIENPTTGVHINPPANALPENTGLLRNHPNPFNAQTIIQYRLEEPCWVKLVVLDITGKSVVPLVQKHEMPGVHQVVWNGKDYQNRVLPSGTYLVVLETNTFRRSLRMELLR